MTTDYSQIPGGEDAWIEEKLAREREPEIENPRYTNATHASHANDTPWGPEVDAQQDADADAEHTPSRECEQCRGFGVVYFGFDDDCEPCFACNGAGEV